MTTLQKHFVTFYSPGTFFDEETTKEISEWDINAARELAKNITERYDARPFGFQFSTRSRGDEDFDSHEINRSPMYYLNATILTRDEIIAKNDPKDEMLLTNMEYNKWNRIITGTAGFRWAKPLRDSDIILD
jgi:hypothetical protein